MTTPLHLVTAILCQRPGTGSAFTPIEKYVERVEAIVDLGIPMTVFVSPEVSAVMGRTAYLQRSSIRLTDLWLCRVIDAIGPDRVRLPAVRNHDKDTLDYLIIQNSKTELCAQVARETGARKIAWIDAGVTKILPPEKLERLRRCADLPEGITIPGRRDFEPAPRPQTDEVSWRFLGGFFCGDPTSIQAFDRAACDAIVRLLPSLTWDCNLWAFLEAKGFPFHRYTAGHDNSFLDFPVPGEDD
jgi:hypothetical protein